MNTWYDENYRFFHNSCYSDIYKTRDSNWDNHQFVSKDKDGNILGFIGYEISRANEYIDGLAAINFSDDMFTFGKDLMNVMTDIFEKFNFRKITFSVVVGNPIEHSYDRLINKYGGRIVGIHKEHCRLMDNKYYDSKIYEIFADEYFGKQQDRKKDRA